MSTTPIDHVPEQPAVHHTGDATFWSVVPGLLWGAALCGILGWWLSISELEVGTAIGIAILLVAACSLGLFVAVGMQWYKGRTDPAKLALIEATMRPLIALGMFAASALLLVLALWLYFANGGREALPGIAGTCIAETLSIVVMALIAAGAGWALRTPVTRQQIFQWMLHRRKGIAIGLMVAGLAIAGLGVWSLTWNGNVLQNFRSNFPGGPEGLGLVLIGAVLLGGGIFTFLNLEQPATLETMRMLTLYAGSLSGFIIALFTAVRMYAWWNRYFIAGMTAWQGGEAWHFWTCIYVEFLGLVLLFGSLLLARVDIRVNVSMRRMLYGYNTVLTGFLLLVILVVMLIFTFVSLPANIEWNRTGMRTISPKTAEILGQLKERVKVYVLMQRYAESYLDVSDLLDNCLTVTDKLTVEYLSPDLDAATYRDLAAVYPELDKQTKSDFKGSGGYGRGLLVVLGEGAEGSKLPHVFIPDKDLEEADPSGKSINFKGENALLTAIMQLANKQSRPKVYFTQSNGELLVNDMDPPDSRILRLRGASELTDKLRKANYEVAGLFWEARPKGVQIPEVFAFSRKSEKDDPKVPDDCNILVIAGPEDAMTKEALKAIDDYMDKGGKLVVLTKAGMLANGTYSEDGMPEFCKKFGTEVKNDFLMRWGDKNRQETYLIQARMAAQNTSRVARAFTGKWFKFFLPRDVVPLKGGGKYQAEVLLEAPPESNGNLLWAETDVTGALQPLPYVRKLRQQGQLATIAAKEPLPVGVSFADRDGKLRGFIIGDYGFVSTEYMRTDPVQGALNFDLFRSCLEVLVERPIIDAGATPKSTEFFVLQKNEEISMGRILWLPMGLIVLGLAGTGAGVWIVRRK